MSDHPDLTPDALRALAGQLMHDLGSTGYPSLVRGKHHPDAGGGHDTFARIGTIAQALGL